MEPRRPGVERLTIVEIGVEKLTPNPWNPNRMSGEMRAKLRAYIEREGFVEPIVVRAHGDGFQILGGFHRWRIAKELGYRTVPCVVVDLDDRRAKILSVNLNEMKGQSLPSLLADLVHDLSRELTLDDLESQLPYSASELKDSLELLKIPDGLEALLEEEAAKLERERPTILSFVVEDAETVEKAIAAAQERDDGRLNRGRALVEIARSYIGRDGQKE
jgi:ParB/RepB/Spo0J family partition protein